MSNRKRILTGGIVEVGRIEIPETNTRRQRAS
jgi:hypothetical protein